MRHLAFLIGLLCAGIRHGSCRIYSGTTDASQPLPALGAFAFGTSTAADGTLGSATLTFSYPDGLPTNGVFPYMFAFADNYDGSNCAGTIANDWWELSATPADPNQFNPLTLGVTPFDGSPHFFYFAAATNSAPDVCTSFVMQYTLDIRQADGDLLGYNEQGLPAIYGVFWAFYLILLGAHVWGHYLTRCGGGAAGGQVFSPVFVRLLTATLALHTASNFFHMIDWATAASSGSNIPGLMAFGSWCRLSALATLWVFSALVARGYGITSSKLFGQPGAWRGLALLGSILITYFSLAIYYSVVAQRINAPPAPGDQRQSAAPGIVLIILNVAFAAWWFITIRNTAAVENSVPKKALLKRLTMSLVASFFILPIAEFVGSVVPLTEATRVSTGIDLTFMLLTLIPLVWFVWPSRAVDACKLYDVDSGSAGLALYDTATLESSGMDEAYSYSAVGSNEAAQLYA